VKLFLGVDGGGTSTVAVVGDEAGKILGEGRAGPANYAGFDQNPQPFADALRAAVREASGGAEAKFEAACFGFSGGVSESKTRIAFELFRPKRSGVVHDALIALTGATAGAPGVITIAGSGSIAFGRKLDGREARAGGWGYIFGDEGSAFDIVRQALRAALRFEEGWGPATALHPALIETGAARDANDLLHIFYRDPFARSRIAALAPIVDQIAQAGDPAAQEILTRAAQSLATMASAVRAQLFPADEPALMTYHGGVLQSAIVRERFRMLIELDSANQFSAPRHRPAIGALIEAYRLAGLSPTIVSP
jgi:N-acetylglucosamine kinase-like BadF-type ATPase